MNFNYCPNCGAKDTVQKQDDTNYECHGCGWHFWNNAKAAVAIALVREDGQLLVAQRGREPNKGKYELAGGFVDFGESVYDAAIREAHEELDIVIARQDLQLIDVYVNGYNTGVFTEDITFLVTRWQGTPRAADDVADVLWRPLDFIHHPDFCQKNYTGLDTLIAARLQASTA